MQQNDKRLSDLSLLRLADVLQLVSVGRSTWWAGVKTGRFPQPVKVGPNTTRWRAEDIREYLESFPKVTFVDAEGGQ